MADYEEGEMSEDKGDRNRGSEVRIICFEIFH